MAELPGEAAGKIPDASSGTIVRVSKEPRRGQRGGDEKSVGRGLVEKEAAVNQLKMCYVVSAAL